MTYSVCVHYCRFALSDALAQIYNFELTPAHLPTRSDDVAVAYTIIPPSAIQLDRTPIGGRGSRGRGSRQGRGDMGLQNGGYASRDVRYRELQVCENRYCKAAEWRLCVERCALQRVTGM